MSPDKIYPTLALLSAGLCVVAMIDVRRAAAESWQVGQRSEDRARALEHRIVDLELKIEDLQAPANDCYDLLRAVAKTSEPTPPPPPTPILAPTPPPASTAMSMGYLDINSIPPSTVYLDGRALGSTPIAHTPVSPGAHRVAFQSPSGILKVQTVYVNPGEAKRAVLRMDDDPASTSSR
jgi:hypothetical protein